MRTKRARTASAGQATEKIVTFVCGIKPDAAAAYLVGDFNKWDSQAHPMSRDDGRFVKALRLLPGEYQYKFVVDGEWHPDPAAAAQVPNAFGTVNSVVNV